MTIEKLVQNFANASGIIVDHTLQPPRVLGQAFIVSKSRLVTCAGAIFNYTEAPWALSVNFCHPGVVLGVKSIALHPEFDRKEARQNYLAQTAISKYSYPVQFNDLATMVMQSEVKEPLPEEVMQLHKALTIPFSRDGVEVSGPVKEGELIEVVKKLLASKRQGLLTLYDELNIPLAYIQLTAGIIERVYFQGVVGEMAFAELIYRQSAKGFAFQPNYSFAWGEIRKIEMPAQDLMSESIRRAHELSGILNQLGGPRACYQRVVKDFSVESFNQNVQWLVSNLWRSIDGYMTVDQLSERVGADTYTMAQGLRELANHGVVSLINKTNPFHLSGQLGTPIISHTDFDINPGDALKAFYLDPLSGAPCWQDGDFGGVASVLQPKNLLHSIPLYLRIPGALILKNYRLIGVHNGPVQLKAGQSADRQIFQMIWIGALFDMGTKKLRTTTDSGEEGDESQPVAGAKLTGLRVRGAEEEVKVATEKLEKYVCPICFAANAQLGNCFNCGAVIEYVPEETKPEGFFINKIPVKLISDLQTKYKLSDRKVFIILGAFAVLLLIIIISSSQSPPKPVHVATPVNNKNAEQAVKLAVNSVGFKGIVPPGYWFEDTMNITNPLPSFGIYSDSSNQKVIFVLFNDMSPVQALDRFTQIPPFSDVVATSEPAKKVYEGSQVIGEGAFRYYVYNYTTASNTSKTMLIGSFPAKESGKGILVLGQTLNPGNFDFKSTLFLVDAMAEPLTNAANQKKLEGVNGHIPGSAPESTNIAPSTATAPTETKSPTELTPPIHVPGVNPSDNTLATEEEVSKYCEVLQEKLQKRVQQSSELQDVIKKRKTEKLKIVLDVDLSKDGQLRKLEIAEPDQVQKVNDTLVKIVKSSSPYENVPRTEGNVLSLRIILNKSGQLKVELQ